MDGAVDAHAARGAAGDAPPLAAHTPAEADAPHLVDATAQLSRLPEPSGRQETLSKSADVSACGRRKRAAAAAQEETAEQEDEPRGDDAAPPLPSPAKRRRAGGGGAEDAVPSAPADDEDADGGDDDETEDEYYAMMLEMEEEREAAGERDKSAGRGRTASSRGPTGSSIVDAAVDEPILRLVIERVVPLTYRDAKIPVYRAISEETIAAGASGRQYRGGWTLMRHVMWLLTVAETPSHSQHARLTAAMKAMLQQFKAVRDADALERAMRRKVSRLGTIKTKRSDELLVRLVLENRPKFGRGHSSKMWAAVADGVRAQFPSFKTGLTAMYRFVRIERAFRDATPEDRASLAAPLRALLERVSDGSEHERELAEIIDSEDFRETPSPAVVATSAAFSAYVDGVLVRRALLTLPFLGDAQKNWAALAAEVNAQVGCTFFADGPACARRTLTLQTKVARPRSVRMVAAMPSRLRVRLRLLSAIRAWRMFTERRRRAFSERVETVDARVEQRFAEANPTHREPTEEQIEMLRDAHLRRVASAVVVSIAAASGTRQIALLPQFVLDTAEAQVRDRFIAEMLLQNHLTRSYAARGSATSRVSPSRAPPPPPPPPPPPRPQLQPVTPAFTTASVYRSSCNEPRVERSTRNDASPHGEPPTNAAQSLERMVANEREASHVTTLAMLRVLQQERADRRKEVAALLKLVSRRDGIQ